eukprot:TRINITY_DN4123_c0_g1_i1.p1 TRINITY_DN4123_c0_g1~~TRINITY_DN4123_c0_g1_i1.p1  ORF type:complete len:273 (-),score=83.63 TRINITY_DN4123_c0_g1_i1:11-829(-)
MCIRDRTATIETYMHKDGRLTALNEFNYEKIDQYEGTQLQYVLILGFEQSGKTTTARKIAQCGYKFLTLGDIKTVLQNRGKTEEVPAENVNVTFEQMVAELRKQTVERENKKEKFVFDDLPLDKMDEMKKIINALGPPAYLIDLACNPEEIKKRISKKREGAELSEEDKKEIDKRIEAYMALKNEYSNLKNDPSVRSNELITDNGEDKLQIEVKQIFEPKLILIKHDSSLNMDIILSNLSIKYEFLYLHIPCLLYTSPSPRDLSTSRMPSSA